MYEAFGAVVVGRRARFALFFPDRAVDPTQYTRGGLPHILKLQVRGSFQSALGDNDWDLASAPVMTKTPHPQGWLYVVELERDLAEGFYEYKYFVTFENGTTRWCTDPCAKCGGGKHENAGFTVGGALVEAVPIRERLPAKDLVAYELMIDDFTSEFRGARAPIDAVHDKIAHLQRVGVNAVEFLPWTAWAGTDFSWGYDPVQLFSVEYRYVHDPKAPADKLSRLRRLINALHERQIHVIMDGVFNHVRAGVDPNSGFAYKWLYQDPADSPYIGSFARGGFFDEFDYANGCVQQLIFDACAYWLDEYQIDGIRFDFTLGFDEDADPNVGITRLVADLRAHLSKTGRHNVSLTIEQLTDNRYDAIDDTNRIRADGCWFDPLMYKSFDCARGGSLDGELLRCLNAGLDFAPSRGPVTYVENHDHSSLVQVAGGRSRWFKAQPAAIALLTSPGMVLIRNGQELGEDYFVPSAGLDRVKPRPLRWARSADDIGTRLIALYRVLIDIRKRHPALRSSSFFPYPSNHPDGYGAFPEKNVVVYHRFLTAGAGAAGAGTERFIVVINYSDVDQLIDIPFSTNGTWEDLLNGTVDTVTGNRLVNQRINSNWGKVYFQTA